MVPAFVLLLSLPQKHAVATSLLVIIPTAFMASIQNHKNGFGNWKVAIAAAIGASITSWIAADWLKQWSDEKLVRFFGAVLVIMGARMLIFAKA